MRRELSAASAASLNALLARARRRLWLRDALRATAAGVLAAAAAVALSRVGHASGAVILACAAGSLILTVTMVFALMRRPRTAAAAAVAIERAEPSLRNLVITAEQLLASPAATQPYMRDRVLQEATRRTSATDPRRVVPLSRDVAAAILAAALLPAASYVRPPASVPSSATGSSDRQPARPDANVVVDVVPPAYTGLAAARLTNPAVIDALEGSEASIAAAAGSRIRLNEAPLSPGPDGAAHAVLRQSGYLAVDSGEVHRLIPLTIRADRKPEVRITVPAKDMRVASAALTIPIAAEAADDLGLQSLELRYTIVSGTGEQFSFTEGTLPAALTRGSERAWRLNGTLSLAALKLEPGDALIYRAVAADRRPGDAGVGSSDTFFVEVAGPGDVPLEGMDMPPEKERYALSEAMIVLKIERLQAREQSLQHAALADAAAGIAAEQRAVRANFIFLLGGEVEDEEVEAETSHEISEGRLANQARREIVAATVLMGRVERALGVVSTREALPLAREAVKALQRAFGHSRYLLRSLPSRVRIDPARRLSGDLASASGWNRALAQPARDPQIEAARSALADLAAASAALNEPVRPPEIATALGRLAERVLAAAGSAGDLQQAGREIAAARDAAASGNSDAARAALRRAAAPLVARAQRGRIDAGPPPRDAARLAGAAALAGGGRRR